ncbi:MAG: glycosyltransferase family 2 protein [Polyangiaceae bacterium]|nr:glycosyltransferase family 2 protein [Polyangiaceae bacterium]
MIVKDEAHVLARCLRTIEPLLSAWAIVDTGSTDGTPEVAARELGHLPGAVHSRPWRDFGTNRTEALELARPLGPYVVWIDADEVLVREDAFELPALDADAYRIEHVANDDRTRFWLPRIVRSSLPFRWVGVLHEYLHCTREHRAENLSGARTLGFFDSARNRDPKAKYARDIETLERALERQPTDARYVFYLAQSQRDAGRLEDAIATYARRAAMGGWEEETWYARYQVAVLSERAGRPVEEVEAAYLAAYELRPSRAEPLCELARLHREQGRHALAWVYANAAVCAARPDDLLFLDASVYEWRALDELSVASYWTGRLEDARSLQEQLLGGGRLPAGERRRVEENLAFTERALAAR